MKRLLQYSLALAAALFCALALPAAAQLYQEEWPPTVRPTGDAARTNICVIRTDAAGNVYVGTTRSSSACLPLWSADMLVTKYDCGGAFQWERTWNNASVNANDYLHSMTLDGGGNVYVTGSTELVVAIGAPPRQWVTCKYDPAGNLIWQSPF